MLGVNYFLLGDKSKAQTILSQSKGMPAFVNIYSSKRFVVAAQWGDVDLTRKFLKHLLNSRSEKWIPPSIMSLLYYAIGDDDNGIQMLEQAIIDHDPTLHMVYSIPIWEKYWNRERVRTLINSWKRTPKK